MKIPRRKFLFISGSLTAFCTLGLARYFRFESLTFGKKQILGEILGASSIGHKLRDGDFPAISRTVQKDVVIVGGGISGLAAGYRLAKAGIKDFALLELENETGGNSSSGKNSVSAYPWGAHYVPLVTEEASAVKNLFEELGIITGYDEKGLAVYNEFYICADPHERLYMYGRWQDGLVPMIGIADDEEKQYQRFFSMMEDFKTRKGKDEKKVFAIPVDKSSQDKEWLRLDTLTMKEWMLQQGFTSAHLCWYVNYCCRDDFGTTFEETSAWAGIHYFASRSGTAANAESSNVITWPEGNGWLTNKLSEPIKGNISTQALAYNISDHGNHVTVDYWDNVAKESVRIDATAVIVATPHFIASRLINSQQFSLSADTFSYSPWAVANITLSKLPAGKGAALCWDNVVHQSELLGYVVATHQITQMKAVNTVITYYWPLSHVSPTAARNEALSRSYQDWQKIILSELLNTHPEIEGHIERMDIKLWGHAMVRPIKNFIWGESRKAALKQHPPIFTAHSDMSGISIFEEAYTHGVRAAELLLTYKNIPYQSVL